MNDRDHNGRQADPNIDKLLVGLRAALDTAMISARSSRRALAGAILLFFAALILALTNLAVLIWR